MTNMAAHPFHPMHPKPNVMLAKNHGNKVVDPMLSFLSGMVLETRLRTLINPTMVLVGVQQLSHPMGQLQDNQVYCNVVSLLPI
jgi:hypothetical protein